MYLACLQHEPAAKGFTIILEFVLHAQIYQSMRILQAMVVTASTAVLGAVILVSMHRRAGALPAHLISALLGTIVVTAQYMQILAVLHAQAARQIPSLHHQEVHTQATTAPGLVLSDTISPGLCALVVLQILVPLDSTAGRAQQVQIQSACPAQETQPTLTSPLLAVNQT